jgi:hypothetical protein
LRGEVVCYILKPTISPMPRCSENAAVVATAAEGLFPPELEPSLAILKPVSSESGAPRGALCVWSIPLSPTSAGAAICACALDCSMIGV